MLPHRYYDGNAVRPAYCLRYSWTAWPTENRFVAFQDAALLDALAPAWESDGLRLLESRHLTEKIQLTFSAKPNVSPVFLAQRAKGRLQHALRLAGHAESFSRKVSVRSVGDNTTNDVRRYIERQVSRYQFIDPRFTATMQQFTVTDPTVDLAQPTWVRRGRYWYNLHIVLVADERAEFDELADLPTIVNGCMKIARKKGYRVASASAMLDHLHLAIRGDPCASPLETALAFQNNLAHLLGRGRAWSENFYVGTFSEYSIAAIRARRGG